MEKFRKKPVVIEAVLWNQNFDEIIAFCPEIIDMGCDCNPDGQVSWPLQISTPEGDMVANLGDWIIKGVNGEFYPCKPDIFEKTYEPAE